METLLNRGKLMTGRDQERLSERDLVMIAKFWGGPVTVNKRIRFMQTSKYSLLTSFWYFCFKYIRNRLIPSLRIIGNHFVAVHCVQTKIVQCDVILLISYGKERIVVEPIYSDMLIVELI